MDIFSRLKAAAADDWASYVDHDFVRQLGDGTLPEAAFRMYLVQDYLFLIQFARAYALATYKSRTLADMKAAQAGLASILDEMELHVRLCGRWGLSPAEIEAAPEHQATVAYTRFVLDCGAAGDLLDLHVTLAPCVIGYAEIGRKLAPQRRRRARRASLSRVDRRIRGRRPIRQVAIESAPPSRRSGRAGDDRAALRRTGRLVRQGVAAGGGLLADGACGGPPSR